jgi:hypothetical protein
MFQIKSSKFESYLNLQILNWVSVSRVKSWELKKKGTTEFWSNFICDIAYQFCKELWKHWPSAFWVTCKLLNSSKFDFDMCLNITIIDVKFLPLKSVIQTLIQNSS